MRENNPKILFKFLLIISVLILLIVIVFSFTLFYVLKILLLVILSVYFLYCIFVLLLWISIIRRKRHYIHATGEDILIVAPHQDDCVAIAGGYAIQTKEKGGQVTVLYVTGGIPGDNPIRRQEALNAWATIGVSKSSLFFLKHYISTGLVDREEIDVCLNELTKFIEEIQPKTIFIPLYEGGNYQHDVTNYMVSEAINRCNSEITVYESPEYNFYFSFETTPEKILSGFARLIPFISYDYSPEPVKNDTVYYLEMTTEQLQLKRQMLAKFTTQNPKQLVKRFGFTDRYQKLHQYDYAKPPFDYKFSLARKINFVKSLPVVGKFMARAVKWTKTIHPDPNYTMTKILFSKDSQSYDGSF